MMMGELPSKHNLQQFHWNLALQPSYRYPTAQIFVIFLQSLMTGNSTNSRPIQTDSFNIWRKTCEGNTQGPSIYMISNLTQIKVVRNMHRARIFLTWEEEEGGESTKMPCVEKIERDRDCLYRKWKEPRGKIPSMSLLIFSKRRLNKKEKYFTSSSSSQSHPWSLCNVNWVGSEEVVVVGTDSKSSASLRPKMHL